MYTYAKRNVWHQHANTPCRTSAQKHFKNCSLSLNHADTHIQTRCTSHAHTHTHSRTQAPAYLHPLTNTYN